MDPEPDYTQIDKDLQARVDRLKLDSLSGLDHALEEFTSLFYGDEPIYTKQMLDKIDQQVATFPEADKQAALKRMAKTTEVEVLRDDFRIYDDSLRRIKEIKDGKLQSWSKFTDNETTKLFYKKEDGKSLYTFYCEKIVEAPISNLISVIAEAQLFKDWIPLLYKSEITHDISHLRKTGEFAVTVPWPFWNRAVYISVSAIPVEDERAVIIVMRSIKGDTWLKGAKIERDTKSCTDCTVHFCGCYIEEEEGPDGKGGTKNFLRLRFLCNVDPHFDNLPQWLLNQGIKMIGLVFLQQVAKKAKNLPDEYKVLIEQKHELYTKVEQHLKRNIYKVQQKRRAEGLM